MNPLLQPLSSGHASQWQTHNVRCTSGSSWSSRERYPTVVIWRSKARHLPPPQLSLGARRFRRYRDGYHRDGV
jgi:hypothetical protein